MILGLETSCDETAAAVITPDGQILANVVSSQADLHARYGGVVPEVASRRHLELVTPVVQEALRDSGTTLDDVDLVGVTAGPGLIGALLVGVAAAKAIAWARRLPLAAVDHLQGHVASLYLEPDRGVLPKAGEFSLAGLAQVIAFMEEGGVIKPPAPPAERPAWRVTVRMPDGSLQQRDLHKPEFKPGDHVLLTNAGDVVPD